MVSSVLLKSLTLDLQPMNSALGGSGQLSACCSSSNPHSQITWCLCRPEVCWMVQPCHWSLLPPSLHNSSRKATLYVAGEISGTGMLLSLMVHEEGTTLWSQQCFLHSTHCQYIFPWGMLTADGKCHILPTDLYIKLGYTAICLHLMNKNNIWEWEPQLMHTCFCIHCYSETHINQRCM